MKDDIKIFSAGQQSGVFSFAIITGVIGFVAYYTYSSAGYKGMIKNDPSSAWSIFLPLLIIYGIMIYSARKYLFKKPAVILGKHGFTNAIDSKNLEFIRWNDLERVEMEQVMGYPYMKLYVKEDRADRSSISMNDQRRKDTFVFQNPMAIAVGNLKYDVKTLFDEVNARMES